MVVTSDSEDDQPLLFGRSKRARTCLLEIHDKAKRRRAGFKNCGVLGVVVGKIRDNGRGVLVGASGLVRT